MAYEYEYIGHVLPDQIVFVTAQELEDMFPDNTPREGGYKAARAKWALLHRADRVMSGIRRTP